MANLRNSGNCIHWLLALTAVALAATFWQAERLVNQPSASSTTPVLSPAPGHYKTAIMLKMSPPASGMEILYTLDGRLPTPDHSFTYQRPIPLNADTARVVTVRARLRHANGELGPTETAVYFLGPLPGVPIVSLVMEPVDLWGLNQGIYEHPDERDGEWERPVYFTYWDENGRIQANLAAGIRIHGNASRFDEKKSWRLYFRSEYGTNRLNAPLFANGVQSYKRLILHAGGQDTIEKAANWTLLRDSLTYELGRAMNGIAPRTKPVILTVNGEVWGVYQLSERLDEYYFADTLGVEQFDWLDTPENINNRGANLDSRPHWDHLMAFVSTHDLTEPDHYAYVATQINLPNLIDYLALQMYAANNDWPHNNALQFRPRGQGGRWRWALWDFQYGLGHARHSSPDTNMILLALEKENPHVTGRFSLLLRQLLQNPEFQERFLTRTADLLNTILAPDAVTSQIDALAEPLETAIAYENARWNPLADNEWAAHVEGMRDFARKRPSFMRQHLSAYFNRETHALTIHIPPTAKGTILLNGLPLAAEGSVWQGVYFHGNLARITAVPAPGHTFNSWKNSQQNDEELDVVMDTAVTLTPTFAPAK
ncbi:MAG: hypothetical protein GY803_02525 [Chloroflexi bacterium]|nr:hypothetical protein [Chloroflexota bacterium]